MNAPIKVLWLCGLLVLLTVGAVAPESVTKEPDPFSDTPSVHSSLDTSHISLLYCPQNAHRPSSERLADYSATMLWSRSELLNSQPAIERFESAMNSMNFNMLNRVLPGQTVSELFSRLCDYPFIFRSLVHSPHEETLLMKALVTAWAQPSASFVADVCDRVQAATQSPLPLRWRETCTSQKYEFMFDRFGLQELILVSQYAVIRKPEHPAKTVAEAAFAMYLSHGFIDDGSGHSWETENVPKALSPHVYSMCNHAALPGYCQELIRLSSRLSSAQQRSLYSLGTNLWWDAEDSRVEAELNAHGSVLQLDDADETIAMRGLELAMIKNPDWPVLVRLTETANVQQRADEILLAMSDKIPGFLSKVKEECSKEANQSKEVCDNVEIFLSVFPMKPETAVDEDVTRFLEFEPGTCIICMLPYNQGTREKRVICRNDQQPHECCRECDDKISPRLCPICRRVI
jgi:hypothetical protein